MSKNHERRRKNVRLAGTEPSIKLLGFYSPKPFYKVEHENINRIFNNNEF
jgi:hypothetical protein